MPLQSLPRMPFNLSDTFRQAVACYQSGDSQRAELLCTKILALEAEQFEVIHLLAVVRCKLGRAIEALALYDKALTLKPNSAEVLNNRGVTLRDLRRYEDALVDYEKALSIKPDYAEALNNRGNALRDLKRLQESLTSYDVAIEIKEIYPEAHFNRGNLLQDLGRFDEALASYDAALAARPTYAEAHYNRGNILRCLERYEDALINYDKALAINPGYAEALNNRGNVLRKLKRDEEALASFDRALIVQPMYPEAFNNRNAMLLGMRRYEDALAHCEDALAAMPDFVIMLNDRGVSLQGLNRHEEALASYDRALAIKPENPVVLNNRGNALRDLMRYEDALASYDKALLFNGDYSIALNNRGNVLRDLGRYQEAAESYEKSLSIARDMHAFSGLAVSALRLCDWPRTAKVAAEIPAQLDSNSLVMNPHDVLAYCDDAATQLKAARLYNEFSVHANVESEKRSIAHRSHDKIRIAYVSADFRAHATASLIGELFECHDRSCFEVVGISAGPDDGSKMRTRLTKAFDQFHDVRLKSDREVVQLMRDLEIDIAIDLMAYLYGCRPGILARRAAPIQVNYLVHPGTLGADYIDYVLADRTVIPLDERDFYAEKVVYLPDCYQVNDSQRRIAARTPTRTESGLPEQGFVFCCFNNNWKITPALFDIWMALLRSVDGSVLWLLRDNAGAEKNLREQAAARGVDPERLVFGDRMEIDEHLARHRLADLFLDTLPVNAHTTASDALWAGLPLLTCYGRSFAGRVAASLLYAIGIPELVTRDLEEYRTLALKLASDVTLLRSIRGKLEKNRLKFPLFDIDLFRQRIEAAYAIMWQIWHRGEPPRSFSVSDGSISN